MKIKLMKIRLMADYDCYPLWEILPDGVRNINPEELPISATLKENLCIWAGQYDATLHRDDPASSAFESKHEEDMFDNTGLGLWKALRSELGVIAEVSYFSQKKHCEVV